MEAPQPVRDVVSNGNWAFLCNQAVQCHPSKSDQLQCTANLSCFAKGHFNVAIELSFSDGSCWVARIAFTDDNDDRRTQMLSEMATMQLVRKLTSIPVPEVYCYNSCNDNDNDFGFPYM